MNFNKIFTCCLKKYKLKYRKGSTINEEVNKVIAEKSELIKLNDSIFKVHKYNIKNTSPFRTNESINNYSKSSLEAMKTEGGKIKRRSSELGLFQNNKIFGLKDKLRCLFCGGLECKHENYINNIENNNAITGLNSNYITDDVIASQRPSEVLINKYNLIKTFKEKNIGLIINLQREGEHPFFVFNAYHLTSSGFSYNPSVFTGNDILCRLYGWKDMSIPTTLGFMMEIVKEMTVMVREEKKKVLVHCHAGYGRTGVVIACYLIFNSFDKNAKDIILYVRNKRKKCVENRKQENFCYKFFNYISHIRTLFIVHNPKEKIETYLKFQEDLLFGEEELIYGIVPILIVKCLEKIMKVSHKYSLNNNQIYSIILKAYSPLKNESKNIIELLKESINENNWTLFDKTENLNIIVFLLFDWFKNYVSFTIDFQRTSKIISNNLFPEIYTILREKKGKIIELCKLIKTSFYSYEYETLYCIALFVANYVPGKNEEDKNNYKGMIDVF